MSDDKLILSELVALSRHLGEESRDLAIIGEGNTSARADDATFWVKASGTNLGAIDEKGFVRMRFEAMLDLLDRAQTDEDVAFWMLDEANVAAVPGGAFGAPGYIRFSYATNEERIRGGIASIKAALERSRK